MSSTPKLLNLFDYETVAKSILPRGIFDSISGGAGIAQQEVLIQENIEAWQKIKLMPRALVDVSKVDTSTTILGTHISLPVLVAPSSYHLLLHKDGERGTAQACVDVGTVMVISTAASLLIEDIAEHATGHCAHTKLPDPGRWLQLYVMPDREWVKSFVLRAEKAGFSALCLTVDLPVLGPRERDVRNEFEFPPGISMVNRGLSPKDIAASTALIDSSLTWKDVEWLRSFSRLPIVIKGVLCVDDALKAAAHGAHAIIVSNHGGRQLECAPTTASCLENIATAVKRSYPSCQILVDGGIRRGSDIVRAVAMGADAVLVGRPILWGLAVGGAKGAAEVLRILKKECEMTMALCGFSSVKQIDASALASFHSKL